MNLNTNKDKDKINLINNPYYKKKIFIYLISIFGIGLSISKKICKDCFFSYLKNYSDLNNLELNCIKNKLCNYLTGNELKNKIRNNIKKLVNINCYKGIRHLKNLPLRGQRTRTNARTCKGPRKLIFKNEFKKNK